MLLSSVTFGTEHTIGLTGARSPMISGRFDGSSNPLDLAVATPTAVQILLGDGTGAFTTGTSIPLPANPATESPFLFGDFSGTGSDIVLLSHVTSSGDGLITYETSHHNDSFTASAGTTTLITDNGTGFTPISGIAADFNGDGDTDIAVVGKVPGDSKLVLAILTSNVNGTFTEVSDTDITGSNSAGNTTDEPIIAGDMGNGNIGVALLDGSGGNLDIFMGENDGTVTALAPVAQAGTNIAVGTTFTASGDTDLVVAGGSQVTFLLSNEDGTFTSPQGPISMGGAVTALNSGDYDSDGNRDIITNRGILLGNGDGTFQMTPIPLPATLNGGGNFSNTLQAGDFNGDGKPDLAGFDAAGNVIDSFLNTTLAPSSVDLESSANPSNPGDDVQLTATVSSTTSTVTSTPTGNVEFLSGSQDLVTVALSNGSATFDLGTGLVIGSGSYTAQYVGDSNFSASTSTVLTQSVLAPTMITLVADNSPATFGEDVAFTATVTGNDGASDVPSGNVEFFDNGTDLGGADTGSNGVATFDTATLSVAQHQITAQYQGDSNFAASALSNTVIQTVGQPALTPTITKSTVPVAVIGGTLVRGRVTVNLTNSAATTDVGTNMVVVYASTDGMIDGNSVMMGHAAPHLNLTTGKSTPVFVTIDAAAFPAGHYTLIAQVTDPSNDVIPSAAGPALTAAAPFVALSEKVITVNLPASAVSGTSSTAFAKVVITNAGNIASKGVVAVAISASTVQGVVGTSINGASPNLNIRADGGTATVIVHFKALPDLANDNYFIVVQATDPFGNTSIGSATGTTDIAAPFVTLSGRFASVPRNVLQAGATFIITNSGNVADVTKFTLELDVTTDAAGADIVGSGPGPAPVGIYHILPGKSVTLHITGWGPLVAALPAGDYYLTATLTDQQGNSVFAVSPGQI